MIVGHITLRIMATVTQRMRELKVLGLTYEKPHEDEAPRDLVCESLDDMATAGHELGHALGKIWDLDSIHEDQLADAFQAAAAIVGKAANQVEQAHRPRRVA